MPHIEPSKLFGAVEGRAQLDDNERRHLEKCEDCARVFAVFQTYVAEDGGRKKGSGTEDSRFKQGDRVCVIGPKNYPVGIVHAVTFAGNVYRYVVQFEDGTTDTFFRLQLRQASESPSQKTG
jgi:hypothetical protein